MVTLINLCIWDMYIAVAVLYCYNNRVDVRERNYFFGHPGQCRGKVKYIGGHSTSAEGASFEGGLYGGL